MTINVPEGKTAYDAVIDEILKRTDYVTNYIVKIWTTNLGYEYTILTPVLEGVEWKWQFDCDWYEGGEIRLLGFMPVEDAEVPNNVDILGRWTKIRCAILEYNDTFECSKCGSAVSTPDVSRFEYCPRCGIGMEV